ncbi:MAG TPA: hypothetical protein VMT97_13640 [Terriglobales bacterium]|nr:hypothetical protein [Terriglobales bacterium]
MGSEEGNDGEAESRARKLRFRIAFYLTSLVALGIVVTLPFSVKSVVDGPVTGRVVKISPDRRDSVQGNHTKLHMAFVSIDETQIIFTLGAITVRAMIYVHDEAGIGLFRRRSR